MAHVADGSEALRYFVNREKELQWLARTHGPGRSRERVIQITGIGGIGKTALVRKYVQDYLGYPRVLWLQNVRDNDHLSSSLADFYRTKHYPVNVVVDDVPATMHAEEIRSIVFNWKVVRSLIVIQRESDPIKGGYHLRLNSLDKRSSLNLFKLLPYGDSTSLKSLVDLADGHPLAIHLIARMLSTYDPKNLERLLQGSVYRLQHEVLVPQRELITSVGPKLILANEQILQRLKRRPEDIHQIGHRKFEELVAELLDDMDFDVELTQATRDGGRDVLAYWNSPVGRLLILVEAKKHRPDRPVGIQLVKQLYGTLMDDAANSAMLVTTSDFSRDARKFEQKHRWQLALKNYADLVQWIENYKNPKPTRRLILP